MKHLQAAGFSVETEIVQNLDAVEARRAVPRSVSTCHTATVAGYIVEGHVPATVVRHLLTERPKVVVGIGVPGMPAGSPGMESAQPVSYEVLAWRSSGATFVYAHVSPDGRVRY